MATSHSHISLKHVAANRIGTQSVVYILNMSVISVFVRVIIVLCGIELFLSIIAQIWLQISGLNCSIINFVCYLIVCLHFCVCMHDALCY